MLLLHRLVLYLKPKDVKFVQERLVPFTGWVEVDENGNAYQRFSFPGISELKERSSECGILKVTVGASTFSIAIPGEIYDQLDTSPDHSPMPIEVIALTREGAVFRNIHWVVVSGMRIEAHMISDS